MFPLHKVDNSPFPIIFIIINLPYLLFFFTNKNGSDLSNLNKVRMKKILLVSFTLITFFVNGQTSVYHPFPDSNAVWNIDGECFCTYSPYPPYSGYEIYSITISADTIINSQTYHKLKIPFVQTDGSSCNLFVTTSGYTGAIREDTTNKKVFFVPPSENTEQLLYDFTMQVGDTVKGYLENYVYAKDIVQSIDSVLVGNSYRKRWNINGSGYYNMQLIEGIGSTYGLIEPSPIGLDGNQYSITCFRQNGQSLYPDTTSNCGLITSVNSIGKTSNEIKIFPNPSQGSFTIDFDKAEIEEIQLMDILGNIILRQKNINQTQINIDNLNSGIYILTIIDKGNKTTNRKIISCP